MFFVDPNRERFGGFQPSEALEVEERFNESWTQKHRTKSLNMIIDFLSKCSSLQLENSQVLCGEVYIPEDGDVLATMAENTSCLPNSFESVIFQNIPCGGIWTNGRTVPLSNTFTPEI